MKLRFLVPRYRTLETPDGRVSSMRWLGRGWDRFVSPSWTLTQWGKKPPLHFICRFKPKDGMPTFAYSDKWVKTHKSRGRIAGITHRPLEVGQLWRRVDEVSRDQGTRAVLRRR
jgi:hypothetical protein